MSKALIYLQSGGPTSVINSSLYGAIREAQKHKEVSKLLGSLHGIEGILDDDIIDIGKEDDEDIELLKQTPAAILGSSRYKLPSSFDDEAYKKILATLVKHNCGYLLLNGGNDSMDTCSKLATYFRENNVDIKVIGVPKTIDNDLALTDHCPGYASACKYVINTVKSVCLDARCYKKGKVYIIEMMGRNAGWLTASVDLLKKPYRPDLIYLPETNFDLLNFLKAIREIHEQYGNAVVALSEGVVFARDVSNVSKDSFGHVQLDGACEELAKIVKRTLGLKTRATQLSLPQRANPQLMSKVDQEEAIEVGAHAALAAINGESEKMVAIKRISSSPYKVSYELVDVKEVANKEKTIPADYMDSLFGMSDKFKEYLTPLIKGEIDIKYEDGICKAAHFKKIRD